MKLIIGGDLVPTNENEDLFRTGDLEGIFGDALDVIKGADRIIVNMELALTDSDYAIPKIGPNIKAHPDCINAYKKLGVTDVMLANNHSVDFGEQGIRDTIKLLEDAGIGYTGFGENDTLSRALYFIEGEGKKIAIVNACEHEYTYALSNRLGANPYDPYTTMADIRLAKSQADFVIVIFHGGKEYCQYPSPRLDGMFKEMVHNGADVVLTQHSHCIGCYKNYQGAHILHGQGNFVFNWNNMPEVWNTALIVELNITDKIDIKFHPIQMKGAGIELAKGEDYDKIMNAFYARNKEWENGSWVKGWEDFCETEREAFTNWLKEIGMGVEGSMERIAHFMVCEAHFDVLLQLFQTKHRTNKL